jgi:hypothetical protein
MLGHFIVSLRGVKSRVPRESTTAVVTGLRAGQFPIVPAGTPALPTKIASSAFQRGRNDNFQHHRIHSEFRVHCQTDINFGTCYKFVISNSCHPPPSPFRQGRGIPNPSPPAGEGRERGNREPVATTFMPIELSLSGAIGKRGTFLLTRILVLQFQSLFDEILFMIEI